MKHLRLLLTLLALLAVGGMSIWAETCTISGTTSGSVNNVLSWNTSKGSSSNPPIWSTNHYRFYYESSGNGGYMTITPQTGITITGITLEATGNSYTPTVKYNIDGGSDIAGEWSGTTMSITGISAKNSFKFRNANTSSKQLRVSITITYEIAASCTTPTFSIADQTISLSEASTADYDMPTNLTINKGGSTGAITYSCDDGNVNVNGNTFYTETAGTYTINATMAADATYCEATTSFTITVQSASCTALAKPTGLNTSNITAITADLSWTAVPNATEYKITYGEDNSGTKQATATTTAYTLTNLTPATDHIWSVKAIGDGSTYCDSEDSESNDFTTAAPPKYTITWMNNGTQHAETEVVQGSAIGTLPADPASCSADYPNFVGWFTEAAGTATSPTSTAPATQVTAETVPTGDATYYAVFSDGTGGGENGNYSLVNSTDEVEAGEYLIAYETNIFNGSLTALDAADNYITVTITNDEIAAADGDAYSFTFAKSGDNWTIKSKSGYYIGRTANSNGLNVNQSTQYTNTVSVSSGVATIKGSGGAALKYNNNTSQNRFRYFKSGQQDVKLYKKTSSGSSATGYISSCCTASSEIDLVASESSVNLGLDGTAVVTLTPSVTSGIAGGAWTHSASGGTLSATSGDAAFTCTFNAAGTYTITSNYDDGSGCNPTPATVTITVLATPMLNIVETSPVTLEALCGAQASATITVVGWNLGTTDVTLTSGSLLVTCSPSTITPADGKVNQPVTLTYTASTGGGSEGGTTTITATSGTVNATIDAKYTKTGCTPVKITFVDRGNTYLEFNDKYAQDEIAAPADPTGVCTVPVAYVFDGWAEEAPAAGATSYTKVNFPYTITGEKTLYAVYKYEEEGSGGSGASKVGLSDLKDGGKYFITATYKGTEYMLKATKFSAGGGKAAAFDNSTAVESDAWTFTKKGGEDTWYIKDADGNYLYCTNDNNGLACGSTEDYYTISTSSGTLVKLQDQKLSTKRYVALYNGSNWRCYSSDNGVQDIQLYSAPSYLYTTAPVCGPYLQIKGAKELYVTGGNAGGTARRTVAAQDSIPFVAGSLQPKADGTEPRVYVNNAANQIHDAGDHHTLNNSITAEVTQTSVTTAEDGTYTIEGYIKVTYQPAANGVTEDVCIVPRVMYNTTATLDSFTVHARALPDRFVIAAQSGGKWYALPADMYPAGTYAGNGQLTVNDLSNPTAATSAPDNCIYSFEGNANGGDLRYVRFVGRNGKCLWASGSETGIKNDAASPAADNSNYNWLLKTTDHVSYTFGNEKSERNLLLYGSDNKFGMYASGEGNLRILPIADSCAYSPKPENLTATVRRSTQATFAWNAVEGADAYEYSLDGGGWLPIADIDLDEPEFTVTGLGVASSHTFAVRAKHGSFTSVCADTAQIAFATANCDNLVAITASGTVTDNCGTISLAGLDIAIDATGTCAATTWGVEYSLTPDFAKSVRKHLTVTSGAVADFATVNEPGTYYFRIYAENEVGTAYSAQFASIAVAGVSGLKIMFENNDNTAPLVGGKASKRLVYYSESSGAVTWTVSHPSDATGDTKGRVDADGYFYGTAMGVYTVTVSQEAKDGYCAATATAYIEVRNPRYHSFVTNCAELNNNNIEVIDQDVDHMDVVVDDADMVKLTIVRDNTGAGTGQTGGQAKDLFFSKYYESVSTLKLVAIYNGTGADIDISDTRITIGVAEKDGTTAEASGASLVNTNAGSTCVLLNQLGLPDNKIKAGQEIVMYTFDGKHSESLSGTDCGSVSWIQAIDSTLREDGTGLLRDGWFNLENNSRSFSYASGTDGSVTSITTAGYLSFSGRQAIALLRGNDMIDIIGSYKTGNTYAYYAGDGIVNSSSTEGDDPGWAMEGYLYDLATCSVTDRRGTISTNRNLLIRLNTVTDGKNAVASNKNAADFITLGTEWAGMQLGKNKNTEDYCKGAGFFSAISDFDYNEYFDRYEPISGDIEITAEGKRQPDGTFRISAGDINMEGFTDFRDLACSSIKIQGFKQGATEPSTTLDYKVPIIVKADAQTDNAALFDIGGQGRTICPDCDVVIRDQAKLQVVKGGYNQLRDVYVYPTGRLQIEDGRTYNARHVYVSSDLNTVGYALVEGTLSAMLGVGHYKRIDALAWYDFSLPYDCKVADIARSNGKTLGEYGTDWFIKYYDGQKRANTGTPNGAAPTNWEHVPADGTLKAGVGYIIGLGGLHEVEPNLPQYKVRISLPNVSGQVYTETNTSNQTRPVTGYTGPKAEELPCHRGWNYIGNPFISLFDGAEQVPEWNTDLLLNGYYTDGLTGQTYEEYPDIYVAVDEGTNGLTDWVQTTASAAKLLPFRAFFVQAVSDGYTDFNKQARTLPNLAPARRATARGSEASAFDLVLTDSKQTRGSARVKIGDGFCKVYEVGHDMVRMINKRQAYPQPYTIDSAGYSMICQAIDRETPVNQTIPVGFYTRAKGTYTFSIDRMEGMGDYAAVYLEDHVEHTVTDLLQGAYTFSAAAGTTDGRFSIYLRESKVPTEITGHEGQEPVIYRHGDAIVIESLPVGAQVRIVDAVGRVLHRQCADGQPITFGTPVRGAYVIQVTSGNDSYSIKTIL